MISKNANALFELSFCYFFACFLVSLSRGQIFHYWFSKKMQLIISSKRNITSSRIFLAKFKGIATLRLKLFVFVNVRHNLNNDNINLYKDFI